MSTTERIKLTDDEKVLAVVRKHWFILLTETIGLIIVAVIPVFVLTYALTGSIFELLPFEIENVESIATFATAAWFLTVWMVLFGAWTDYYLDVWTITNKRIIAVDQRGFFYRRVASFRLERLQDLNVEIRGFIATALDFGTLEAETASEDDFVVHGIPKPREVKALIQEATDRALGHTAKDGT